MAERDVRRPGVRGGRWRRDRGGRVRYDRPGAPRWEGARDATRHRTITPAIRRLLDRLCGPSAGFVAGMLETQSRLDRGRIEGWIDARTLSRDKLSDARYWALHRSTRPDDRKKLLDLIARRFLGEETLRAEGEARLPRNLPPPDAPLTLTSASGAWSRYLDDHGGSARWKGMRVDIYQDAERATTRAGFLRLINKWLPNDFRGEALDLARADLLAGWDWVRAEVAGRLARFVGTQRAIGAGLAATAREQQAASGVADPLAWLAALPKIAPEEVPLLIGNHAKLDPETRALVAAGLTALPRPCPTIWRRLVARPLRVDRVDLGATVLGDYHRGHMRIALGAGADTVAHEFGHHIEDNVHLLDSAARRFVLDRATGLPRRVASSDTWAYPDEFLTSYTGRTYTRKGFEPFGPTEVIATGVQALYTRPGELLAHDPEHFWLTLGALLGDADLIGQSVQGATVAPAAARPAAARESRGGMGKSFDDLDRGDLVDLEWRLLSLGRGLGARSLRRDAQRAAGDRAALAKSWRGTLGRWGYGDQRRGDGDASLDEWQGRALAIYDEWAKSVGLDAPGAPTPRPLILLKGKGLGARLRDYVGALLKAEGGDVGDAGGEKRRELPSGGRWITVHPNGKNHPGHPIYVVPSKKGGNNYHVVGGAGGRLNHMTIQLKSPEEWAKNSEARAAFRKQKEAESGVTAEDKAGVSEARKAADRAFVQQVADVLGWRDYREVGADDFMAEAKGSRRTASRLAQAHFRSWLKRANEAVDDVRRTLRVDREAHLAAEIGLSTDPDPYVPTQAELSEASIAAQAAAAQAFADRVAAKDRAAAEGPLMAVDRYTRALEALRAGDEGAAAIHLRDAKQLSGQRNITAQDIMGVDQKTVADGSGMGLKEQAREHILAGDRLTAGKLRERVERVRKETGVGDAPIAPTGAGEQAPPPSDDRSETYMGRLELGRLDEAIRAAEKGDLPTAADHLGQADKFGALRVKFRDNPVGFAQYRAAREDFALGNPIVAEVTGREDFGAKKIDPDVKDMRKAKELLLLKAQQRERRRRLRAAERTLDPAVMRAVVGGGTAEVPASELSAESAVDRAMREIEEAEGTRVATELIDTVEGASEFLGHLSAGEADDDKQIGRYVEYGRASAFEVVSQHLGSVEMLDRRALDALGTKGSAKLLADYLVSTRQPREFEAIRRAIVAYHQGRQFDVANGALVAARAVLAEAKEFDRRALAAGIDDLAEMGRYNVLRAEAVDSALATLGTAYGELNAIGELNFAMEAARRGGEGGLTMDLGDQDPQGMVNLANALGLGEGEYALVDKGVDADGNPTPRGLKLTPDAVNKVITEGKPPARERRKFIDGVRRGDEDREGWLPAYFRKAPADSFRFDPEEGAEGAPLDRQRLIDPEAAAEALDRAIAAVPTSRLAFAPVADLGPQERQALREYFEETAGVAPIRRATGTPQPPAPEPEDDPTDPDPQHPQAHDQFGQPLAAAEGGERWKRFVRHCGKGGNQGQALERAYTLVQEVLRGGAVEEFAKHYEAITDKPLTRGNVGLTVGNGGRATIGPEAERQLGDLAATLGHRYGGARHKVIPDMSMSGKFVNQQRVIKALLGSGGLNGQEGGRMGGFLGVGCVRHDTPIRNPLTGETRTIHEWMVSGDPLHVVAYDEVSGVTVVAEASRPFIKGYERMYAVVLGNGETINATAAHRFLTPQGWRRLDQLTSGDHLIAAPRAVRASWPPAPHAVPASMTREPLSTTSGGDHDPMGGQHSPGYGRRDVSQHSRAVPASMTDDHRPRYALAPPATPYDRDWYSRFGECAPSPAVSPCALRTPRECVASLPATNSVGVRSTRPADVPRSSGTPAGSLPRYSRDLRRDDAPARPARADARVSAPPPSDVREHSPLHWLRDDPGAGSGHIRPCRSSAHPSSLDDPRPVAPRPGAWSLSRAIDGNTTPVSPTPAGQHRGLPSASALSRCPSVDPRRRGESRRREVPGASGLASCVSILAITPTTEEVVYDLTVPIYHNYIAYGVINHNSGKTSVSIGGFTTAHAQGKAKAAIFAVPSAVQGQFGKELATVIDPSAGLRWHTQGDDGAARRKSLADPNTHFVVTTHQSLRDDTLHALADLWGMRGAAATTIAADAPPAVATPDPQAPEPQDRPRRVDPLAGVGERFAKLSREGRAVALRQAWEKAGWAHRLDYFSVDEGQNVVNRKGKEDALMAMVADAIGDSAKYYLPLSVAGDSRLFLRQGDTYEVITIAELAERFGLGEDEVLEFGAADLDLRVRSYDPETNTLVWAEVYGIHKYRCDKRTYRIKAQYGHEVVATQDHSVYVARDGRVQIVGAQHVTTDDYMIVESRIPQEAPVEVIDLLEHIDHAKYVAYGDFSAEIDAHYKKWERWNYLHQSPHGPYLPLPKLSEHDIDPARIDRVMVRLGKGRYWAHPRIPAEALAYLVGLVAGDGWVGSDFRLSLAVADGDIAAVETYLETLREWFALTWDKRQYNGCVNLRISCRPLGELFHAWFGGQKAPTKRLPGAVFGWSLAAKREVLRGLIDSDGYVGVDRGHENVVVTSTSRNLLFDAYTLLKYFGLVGSIYARKDRPDPRPAFANARGSYQLRFLLPEYERKIASNFERNAARSGVRIGDAELVRVTSVAEAAEEFVYDISVRRTENFVINGTIVHNTGTPVKNDPSEAYDWLMKIRPDEYKESGRDEFMRRHGLVITQGPRSKQFREADRPRGVKDWTRNAAAEALQQELGAAFYSTNVPLKIPVRQHRETVQLSDSQRAAYRRVGELVNQAKAHRAKGNDALMVDLTRQLAPESFRDDDGRAIPAGDPREVGRAKLLLNASRMLADSAYNRIVHETADDNAKMDHLEMLVGREMAKPSGSGQRVRPGVIFTRSLAAVDTIYKKLDAKYPGRVGMISGKSNGQQKLDGLAAFTDDKHDILICSDAMAAGADLPRGEWLMHYDIPWTSMVHEQRSARVARLSTKHPVDVFTLATDTPFEQERLRAIERKGSLGDTTQNPAEMLDDSSISYYARQARREIAEAEALTPSEAEREATAARGRPQGR